MSASDESHAKQLESHGSHACVWVFSKYKPYKYPAIEQSAAQVDGGLKK